MLKFEHGSIQPSDLHVAAEHLEHLVIRTPFVRSTSLSNELSAEVFLKFENLQHTGSFKARGACLKIQQLSPTERARGVVAMSAGNHAQAVAYFAKQFGVKSTIVMPENPSSVKLARTRALGAEVLIAGQSIDEAKGFAYEIAARRGAVLVHPYDDPLVILGQASLGYEMFQQVSALDDLFVAIGGGGLASGVCLAKQLLSPQTRIFGVQALAFPAMYNKIKGFNISPGRTTVADGIAVGTPGVLTHRILSESLADIFLVSDTEIESALVYLLETEKALVEGAGAAGLAALMKHREQFIGRRVGLILCGGNVELRFLAAMIERSMVRTNRLSRLSVLARDLPGSLAHISKVVAEAGANVERVEHERGLRAISGQVVRITLEVQTRDRNHLKELEQALSDAGFETALA
ncbi:MAG: L-threonine dehydratase catabolic TdcB [Pseudomonadota bacterium]